MELTGKQVAVLGAGGSGYAAAALARARGAEVCVFDSGAAEKLATAREGLDGIGVPLVCGADALEPPHEYDYCVVSPGIDLAWPIARSFAAVSGEVLGEIELAWRLGSAPVIGITGTNGKTTTTSLIESVLKASGLRAIAAGNIGLPYSEVVLSGAEYDWIVLELSSFQLETISTFAPRVAVWMNFAPDHMDRYRSVEDYHAAKMRIFDNLDADSLAICKLESDLHPVARTVRFSAFSDEADLVYEDGEILDRACGRRFAFRPCTLQGKHNAENVMAALAVMDELGIAWDDVAPAITGFQAPPHRCELVGEIDGVRYLNDSKSTNLHSLSSALAGQESSTVLIVGGKEKGLDFAELRDVLGSSTVREVLCIGEIGERIAAAWEGIVPCHYLADRSADLDVCVATARSLARPGEVVLFSPGTSSFDMFANYVARGEAFRQAVHRAASVSV